MAKACPSSPNPLLSSGQSLAAPVAERVWALPFPAFSGAYLCLWSPRARLPHPGLDPDSAPLHHLYCPTPATSGSGWRPGGLSCLLVLWDWARFVPGVARRQDKGSSTHRQRGSAITAALVWTHWGGNSPPSLSSLAPPSLRQLPDGTSSLGLGHHMPLTGSWATRPGPWCLRPCGHSSPVGLGLEVAWWVLALLSVLGRQQGALFFLCCALHKVCGEPEDQ